MPTQSSNRVISTFVVPGVATQMANLAPSESPPPPAQPHPSPPTTLYSCRSINPNIKFFYIRDSAEANRQLSRLQKGPLGFDLEWKPTFVKGASENPVALVQLATKDTVLLIQVSAMEVFPEKLLELLESPDVVKSGVGIQNDVKKLHTDYFVSTRNCVDLSLLARSVDNARWKGRYSDPIGLARLVEAYEQMLLPKGKITRSNWEAFLNAEQQEYASNDAHAGYAIYIRLMSMAQVMTAIPKASCYTFDFVRGRLCEPSGMHWSPHNPHYDPGPPPPPKLPKPPKASHVTVVGAKTIATSYHGVSSVSSAPSRFINPPATGTPCKRPYIPLSPRPGVPHAANPRTSSGSHFPESTWTRAPRPGTQPHAQPHFPYGSGELPPGRKRPRRWHRLQPQDGPSGGQER